MMDALRIANLIVWGVFMLPFMASGAWSAMSGREMRRGDPMRLACFATGLIICGFNVRGMIAPDDELSRVILYLLSIADGVFIMLLARAYGRGPRV